MIYLASPYSDPQQSIVDFRVAETRRFAAWLWREGFEPISPILHWHEAATLHSLPTDADTWMEWNRALIRRCDAVHLLCLPNWQQSKGVAMELEWACVIGLHVTGWRLEWARYVKQEI
jgi:nucleoside 2-deoxyribosyltransferase